MGMFLWVVIRRDIRLALRQGSDSLMVVAFYVVCVALFPFGVGPQSAVLERLSSGILWVTALLACVVSLDRLFQQDYDDGSLDLLFLSPLPLPILVLGKVVAHWVTTGLPLLLSAPLLAVLLHMDGEGFAPLVIAMALGTPTLSLIGSVGAALVLGARRGGVLLSLLVLPLYVPVLIFGVLAIDSAVMGFDVRVHLLILGAMFTGALALCPWAASAALRQAVG